MYVCPWCLQWSKQGLDHLEPELQTAVSCHGVLGGKGTLGPEEEQLVLLTIEPLLQSQVATC